MALGMALGLQHLHKNDVIHRDIHLGNFLLNDICRVLICDFGLSRKLLKKGDTIREYYKPSGEYEIGWRWTAPEALATAKFTKVSDMWSFGVCIWELLNNELPFLCTSNPNMLIYERAAVVLDIGPAVLREIVTRCVSHELKIRLSMGEIVDLLRGKSPRKPKVPPKVNTKSNIGTPGVDTPNNISLADSTIPPSVEAVEHKSMTHKYVQDWTVKDVSDWLTSLDLDKYIELFKNMR
eukprot:TRINITY_DN188_c0_g2_i2.p1 TRINITY_DN188_c0_g2~~TRINITY_DN188_c0_g2_i2.p1  ORF type:complete len:237 (-),score=27.82 TRINITY_DN188_c0_g2_i2:296-1006(-)